MKKFTIFILILVMVCGCSVTKLDTSNLDSIVGTVMSTKAVLSNRISRGYKYYLPKGVKLINYTEYNEKLYSGENTYYLYVDIVSYHYKTKNEFNSNYSSYYHRQLDKGYVDISKMNDKYFIRFEYNYAKMESIVKEKDIDKAITDMSYILSSIQYNDVIIDSFIGENTLSYNEEKYTIKKPKENEQTFLDYVNTYDTYKGEEKVEEDNDTITNTKQEDELN